MQIKTFLPSMEIQAQSRFNVNGTSTGSKVNYFHLKQAKHLKIGQHHDLIAVLCSRNHFITLTLRAVLTEYTTDLYVTTHLGLQSKPHTMPLTNARFTVA